MTVSPLPDFTVGDLRYVGLLPAAAAALLIENGATAFEADAAVLAATKQLLKAQVDAEAERLRLTMITAGAGQAMEYQQAQADAAAALKAPSSATPVKYPMLAASIGLDVDPETGQPATDVLGVARSVDAARVAWLGAGAMIRGVRLGAKRAIDEATTIEAAHAAYSAVSWAPPAA